MSGSRLFNDLLVWRIAVLFFVLAQTGAAVAQAPEEALHRYHVPIFNPASNRSQRSWLRLINSGDRGVEVVVDGLDDQGAPPPEGTVRLILPAGAASTLTAEQLEDGGAGFEGRFGDGEGKWQLYVLATGPIEVMSLLHGPAGSLGNVSGTVSSATRSIPLFLPASRLDRQGFVRIINRSAHAGTVRVHAIDDTGRRFGPVTLSVGAKGTAHFNSGDLESGNPSKGLSAGVGDGHGYWRLELDTDLDILPLAYVRSEDGVLIGIHDVAAEAAGPIRAGRPNVLFIAIDDMNTWIAPFNDSMRGKPLIAAPSLQALASRGVAFTNAHTPVPLCNPTRASIVAGVYPRDNVPVIAQYRGEAFIGTTTLTQHFRHHGYLTLGGGKIFPRLRDPHRHWDVHEAFDRPADQKRHPDRVLNGLSGLHSDDPFDWGEVDYEYREMSDVEIAEWAIEALQAEYEQPFFLGVGFHFPHLPWYLPGRYLEQYPLESIELPEIREDDLEDVPPEGRRLAWAQPFSGTHDYEHSDHSRILESGQWKEAVRAYSAANTFVDELVGRVLEALRSSRHADDTVVVVFADNGWHLGEKQRWRKKTLWEESTRIPLILSYPAALPRGRVVESAVSLVDLYPTLLELSGLPRPGHQLDGRSLLRAIEEEEAAGESFAISIWGTGNVALRDRRWRYIRYAQGGEELYDHENDPMEYINLLARPDAAQHAGRVARFNRLLDRYHPRSP